MVRPVVRQKVLRRQSPGLDVIAVHTMDARPDSFAVEVDDRNAGFAELARHCLGFDSDNGAVCRLEIANGQLFRADG